MPKPTSEKRGEKVVVRRQVRLEAAEAGKSMHEI
jgi:hypothetical protein